jgi:hypothetical protein
MIEGACRNARDAHPGRLLDDRMARGIAKRATGTIASQWSDLLAAPDLARSRDGLGKFVNPSISKGAQGASANARAVTRTRLRGASQVTWRAPLRQLHRAIGAAMRPALKDGNTERAEALRDVLRLIGMMVEQPEPLNPRTKLTLGRKP